MVNAVQGVDFEIEAGKIYCLLGTNGAGKSTVFKLLLGEEYYDKGNIRLGDHYIPRDIAKVQSNVGYCAQNN